VGGRVILDTEALASYQILVVLSFIRGLSFNRALSKLELRNEQKYSTKWIYLYKRSTWF